MSEHSDEYGSGSGHDPEPEHDGSSSEPPASGHDDAGDGLLGPGHPGEGDHQLGGVIEPAWHPADEAAAGDPQPGAEAAAGDHHATESAGGDDGDALAGGRDIATEAAVAGTLFEPVPEPEPAWLAGVDSSSSLAETLHAGHYASGWARDDGTGLIGALAAEAAAAPAPEPDGADRSPETFAGPVTDFLYGGHDAADRTAGRLWEELGPQTPVPTDDRGEPLPAAELLAELARHLADPADLSVVQAALNHVRAGGLDR